MIQRNGKQILQMLLSKLSKYAAGKNINVLVENHGYLSSNADLLVEVMEKGKYGKLWNFTRFR